jgi:hypothetical protein
MKTQRQRIIWGYASELIFAVLVTGALLILDRNGTLPRTGVLTWAGGVHKVIAEHLLAGVFSWAAILGIPFLLIAFAGDELKRQILEQGAFTVFYRAYAVTTGVLAFTYFLSPTLLKTDTVTIYGLFAFLWTYSTVLLVTAATNASVFLWLVQAMYRLERDIRNGKYDRK